MSARISALLLLALLALSRWPGLLPPNFSPVYALAFCSGVYLPGRLAWWVPMTVLLASDVCLNFHYGVSPVSGYMALNYVAYALLVVLGRRFSARSSWLHLLGGGLLGAILFYLITNTAAWFNPAPGPFAQLPYPKTVMGWLQALTSGSSPWPPTWTFFRNTLLSGGLFTGLFFGAQRLSERMGDRETEDGEEAPQTGSEAEPSQA